MSDEPFYSVFRDDGQALAAAFCVTPSSGRSGRYALTFKSSGGTTNRDYNEALNLVLQRLARMRATIDVIEVVSTVAMKLPEKQRIVEIDGYDFPLRLDDHDLDHVHLRKRIGAGASRTARSPKAKKKNSGGNTQKRLCFTLAFAGGRTQRVSRIVRAIRGEFQYRTPTSRGAVGKDAPKSKPKTKPKTRSKSSRGAGRQMDQETKKAVEEYAMQIAMAHFAERTDWKPTRVDGKRGLGYDIRCARGKRRLYIEVKGSTGTGGVHLTAKEVDNAHTHSEASVLFVVANIEVDKTVTPRVCAGGAVKIYESWDPHASGTLTVATYTYTPPRKPSIRYPIES